MTGGIDEVDDAALPLGSGGAQSAYVGIPDLPGRLPQGRGAAHQPSAPVPPPLQRDRQFHGAADEPIAPTGAAPTSETLDRPATAEYTEAEPRVRGLALPQRVTRISTGRKVWFGVSFLAPVILGALYLFLIAPDQYVTEFRFSVRVPVGQQGALASGGASPSALFGGNPTPGTDLLDNFTVADYVRSSQAADDLNAKLNLKDIFNKPSDPFARVGGNANRERLAKFWRSMVYADYDVTTGLAIVRVRAYTPQDSYALASALLQQSNDLVNSIGLHSQQDSVRFAESQVQRINTQLAILRSRMVDLRRDKAIISPNDGGQDVVSGNEVLTNRLRATKSELEGAISQLMAQLHNPAAPQILLLQRQLAANDQQLVNAQHAVGGGADNLAQTVGQFEQLQTDMANADKVLTNAQNNLAYAQASADAQRLYITTYVKPTLPESSTAPNRWLDLLILTIVAGLVWIIGMLVRNSIIEHAG